MTGPFAQVCGADTENLSGLIKDLHAGDTDRHYAGRVTVTAGRGLAQLATRLAGFPPSMQDAPFALHITPTNDGERWTRQFGARHITVSHLAAQASDLRERFGPITTTLIPYATADGGLGFSTGRAWCMGVPLPRMLSPQGTVTATQDGARYIFDITGALPGLGRVIRYTGWLAPKAP